MVKQKTRGIWLNIWLSLMFIGSLFSGISNLLFGNFAFQLDPTFPLWSYTLFGIAALLNLVFVIFLFLWKKWAFYGVLATTIIVFAVNLYVGISFLLSSLGFLGVIILYLSMRSRWKLFH